MQNRYAGDVGDFEKIGLLRQIIRSELGIGVNWYLTPDENHNADGEHIRYTADPRYNGCDVLLRNSLREIVISQRNVAAIEAMNLIPNAFYFREVLHSSSRTFSRRDWHNKALEVLRSADIVFLDPDNGILVKVQLMGAQKAINM